MWIRLKASSMMLNRSTKSKIFRPGTACIREVCDI